MPGTRPAAVPEGGVDFKKTREHAEADSPAWVQVLEEAAAVDARAAAGEDVRPLCGLAFAVKDNIDVAGYPTEAGTPALQGNRLSLHA